MIKSLLDACFCIRVKLLLALLAGLWAVSGAFAEESSAFTEYGNLRVHQVAKGDTLYDLAARYLDDATMWPAFLQYNDIRDPKRLRPGSELRIPPLDLPGVHVIFALGDVHRVADDNSRSSPVEIGDQLRENDKVSVGDDSYLTLQFDDGSIMRVLSDSQLQIQRYRASHGAKPRSRIIVLDQGNLDISVTPANKNKAYHFEVITPQTVAAARGTRFDVSASDTGTASGVTEGSIAVRQSLKNKRRGPQKLLEAGKGLRVGRNGKLGSIRPLLAAADLSMLPSRFTDADYLVVNWPALENASSYQVRLASDQDMRQVVANMEPGKPVAKFTGLDDGEYIMGVRAVDAEGIIGFESTQRIRIEAQPAFPFYLGPANRQFTGRKVDLSCTQVQGAVAYRFQLSESPDFSSAIVDTVQQNTCSHTVSDLGNGRYFWRVASIATTSDGLQKQGPFSEPTQFEVADSSVTDGRQTTSGMFWLDDRNLEFTAQISSDEKFANIVSEQTLQDRFISMENLSPGRYFIRVQATDTDSFTTAFSTPRIVTINPVEDTVERTWADKPKY